MSDIECSANYDGRTEDCSFGSHVDDFEVISLRSRADSDSSSNSPTSGTWDDYIDGYCQSERSEVHTVSGRNGYGSSKSPVNYERQPIVSNLTERYSTGVPQTPSLPDGRVPSGRFVQSGNTDSMPMEVRNTAHLNESPVTGVSAAEVAHSSHRGTPSHNSIPPPIVNRNSVQGEFEGYSAYSTNIPQSQSFPASSGGKAPSDCGVLSRNSDSIPMKVRDTSDHMESEVTGVSTAAVVHASLRRPTSFNSALPLTVNRTAVHGEYQGSSGHSTQSFTDDASSRGFRREATLLPGLVHGNSFSVADHSQSIYGSRGTLHGLDSNHSMDERDGLSPHDSFNSRRNYGFEHKEALLTSEDFEGNEIEMSGESGNYFSRWKQWMGEKISKTGASRRPKKTIEDYSNMTGDVTDSKKLDLSKLLELAKLMEREIKVLQDKDIALVIGKTGGGKSTVVNYLLKKKLRRVKDDTGEVIFELDRRPSQDIVSESEDKQSATIGHEYVSETTCPKGFVTEKSFILIDNPGFEDNRSKENDAATYLALQMLIKTAARIKGIIVVLSVDDFKNRAAGLNKTLSLLQRLILPNDNCSSNYRNSVIFVFTHADDCSGEVKTVEQVQNLMKKAQHALKQRISGDPRNERLAASLALCHIMLSCGVKTVVFDPINEQCDEIRKTVRDIIFDFVESSRGIPKEDIAFRVETIFQRYSDTFCQIANSFLISSMTITEERSRIHEYEKRIDCIKADSLVLEKINDNIEEFLEKHEGIEAELQKAEHKTDLLRDKISRQNHKYQSICREKDELENDRTLTLVHTANVYLENDVYGVVLKGDIKYHTFNYSQSFPIADVEYKGGKYAQTEGSSQKFSAPSYNKDRTEVEIKYTGPSHEYGSAEFEVFSEKRFTPDAKCEVERYLQELQSIKKNLDDLESDLEQAKKIVQHILERKFQVEEQCKEQLIKSNKSKIAENEKEETKLAKEIEDSNQKIKSAEDLLTKEEAQYKMLVQFHSIAPFEEKTILEFISKYECFDEHEEAE